MKCPKHEVFINLTASDEDNQPSPTSHSYVEKVLVKEEIILEQVKEEMKEQNSEANSFSDMTYFSNETTDYTDIKPISTPVTPEIILTTPDTISPQQKRKYSLSTPTTMTTSTPTSSDSHDEEVLPIQINGIDEDIILHNIC